MDTERRKKELIDAIEEDGLIGPWSWSDQLSHVATIVAYGILRRNVEPENYEVVIDGILEYVKTQALYIATRPPKTDS